MREVIKAMNLPNQKMITIHRDNVKRGTGRQKPFLIAYQENLKYAMKSLSGTGFKVYMMLVFNTDNYRISFSPKFVSLETGISLDSARKALKELEEKKFIIAGEHLHYDFYEEPQMMRINLKAERKEFVDEDTGEILNLTYEELLDIIKETAIADNMWRDAK